MIGGTENSKLRSAILTTKLVIIRMALRGSHCGRRRLRFLVMKENLRKLLGKILVKILLPYSVVNMFLA